MKKRFTWTNFETGFIRSIVYSENTPKRMRPTFDTSDKESLIPYIDSICSKPDEHFVRHYRKEIMENFLKGSINLVNIAKALQKNCYKSVKLGEMNEMYEQISSLRLSSTVMTLILGELYRTGNKSFSDDDEFSIFATPKVLDLKECIPGKIPLHKYQEEAKSALHKYFVDDNKRAGILVMPTGSGKTRVASNFLIESFVAEGWQVIWLTHRAMLIEQTATSIYSAAGAILSKKTPEKETFKMVCVSGSHASVKATEKDDDVMIFGVQSLLRNLPYLKAVVREKVMIIVDEAHHTLAPSYRIIINEIQKIASESKLLGLTATPVRMSPEDTARLMAIFDNEFIYNVSMSKLVAEGYLSEPHYEKVETKVEFETIITLDEQKYIQKWGELSPETLEKMARMTERNVLIADTYVKNKDRYGKTLIFALNSTHCIALCEELKKRGVKCDYIYCAHSGNEEKIARFKRGELDVLVNIQVLTEGSDVPDIKTVFLTRPTSSDVLLMQMLGRGMRGVGSGGTATVNVVDFNDVWDRFSYWLSASLVIDMIMNGADRDEESKKDTGTEKKCLVPWEMYGDIIKDIKTSYALNKKENLAVSLPVGWYDVVDEDGCDSKVLVFESQLSGYTDMWKHKSETLNNPDFNGNLAVRNWFGGMDLLPTASDIDYILNTYRLTGEFPHLNQFKVRNKIDPAVIAEKMMKENVGVADVSKIATEIYEENSIIIDSIYGDADSYARRIMDFLYYPRGIRPLGMRIEEVKLEELNLDITPYYDIDELKKEVLEEMFDGEYGEAPEIYWSKEACSSFYGKYYYRENGDFIRINCLLNSKDVPRDTVKYVIYHELLHKIYHEHDSLFRKEEHKFKDWTEHERFLDFTFPKFNKKYCM